MNSHLRLVVACFCFGWMCAASAQEAGLHTKPEQTQGRRRALLVGCTEYPTLGPKFALQGPANDVELFDRLLRERFQFGEADIVRLVHVNALEGRPLRANIVKAMERLIAEARAGDEILILFSGHGSQQPDEASGGDEADGLDEVFLPEDVRSQASPEARVAGISDDEIERWLTALRERGAFVFFIADACHSGTMSRSSEESESNETFRFVPADVLTPTKVLQDAALHAQQRADRSESKPEGASSVASLTMPTTVGGLAALYAVPPQALEREHPMPPPRNGRNDPRYGRLSYALNQVLLRAERPLTYRELAQQITWQYRCWNWFPGPLLEASSVDREVLNKREWHARSALMLTRSVDGTLMVDQGLAHGLTIGSVLKVFGTNAETGFVRVTSATPFSAIVEPTTFEGSATLPAEKFESPSRCEVVEVDYGQLRVSVRVRQLREKPDSKPSQSFAQVQEFIVETSRRKDSIVRPAAMDEVEDVTLLVGENAMALRRRGPDEEPSAAMTQESFGPYPLDDELSAALARDLRQIALVRNLLRLADNAPQPDAREGKSPFGLKIQVERASVGGGDWTAVDDVADARFTNGDLLRLRLQNTGLAPLDATVVYIDSRCKIQNQYPTLRAAQAGTYNTIEPRKSHEVVIKINDGTIGWEDVLVFAVLHAPPISAHFAFLEQPGLTPADLRTMRGGARSPLDELLAAALGGARAASRKDRPPTFAVRRIPIEVFKSPRQP